MIRIDSRALEHYRQEGAQRLFLTCIKAGCAGRKLRITSECETESVFLGIQGGLEIHSAPEYIKLFQGNLRATQTPKGWVLSGEALSKHCSCGSSFGLADDKDPSKNLHGTLQSLKQKFQKKAPTLIIIHGGESFKEYNDYLDFLKNEYKVECYDPEILKTKLPGWKEQLRDEAHQAGTRVFMPLFPNKLNASYTEWCIVFEKILKQVEPGSETTYIGHSLGGVFLLQYLQEHPEIFQRAGTIHALGAPMQCGNFSAYGTMSGNAQLHLWHSSDDTIVPIDHFFALQKQFPLAQFHTFENRGHFIETSFPELRNFLISHSCF